MSQDVEKNTFQTLLITDGLQSFVLTTYKSEEMNWNFEYNRRVAVGFMSPTPAYRKDYNYFNSKVTTRLDVLYGSAGRYTLFTCQLYLEVVFCRRVLRKHC